MMRFCLGHHNCLYSTVSPFLRDCFPFQKAQMQKLFSARTSNQNSPLRCGLSNLHLFPPARRFVTQKTPGFGSNTPPAGRPRPYKPKSQDTDASRLKKRKNQAGEQQSFEEAAKPKSPWRFRIGPGKIIFLGIFAYVSYRIYNWQTDPHRSILLEPRNFTPFILDLRKKVSSTSSILNLRSVPRGQNSDNVAEAWRTGVWSVEAMQPELQIARCYTPLPPAEDAEPEQLRLFVRKEPQGEVSQFLHRISRGTLVHLRGPRIEYTIPEDVEEVLFLAGGTGIAPALQVAHTLYNHRPARSENGPKLRILWANRRSEDSHINLKPASPEEPQNLLTQEIESLKAKHAGKFDVEYFVDEESSYITESLLRNYLRGVKQVSDPSSQDSPTCKKLLLVSGPEGFVNLFAGPKSMMSGREIQGPLGGMLDKIKPAGWEIWKL